MLILLVLVLALTAPQLSAQTSDSLAISTQELTARLRFFSSDFFEGRYPGKRGEELTTAYLISELQSFGVRPGAAPTPGDSGASWLQPVQLLVQGPDSASPVVEARLSGRISGELAPGREATFVNGGRRPDVEASGDLVFVGYGIDAPMYKWNDFAGIDLQGKVAVMLFGEPTIPGDTLRFNGVRASRFSDFRREAGRPRAEGSRGHDGDSSQRRVPRGR